MLEFIPVRMAVCSTALLVALLPALSGSAEVLVRKGEKRLYISTPNRTYFNGPNVTAYSGPKRTYFNGPDCTYYSGPNTTKGGCTNGSGQ